MGGTGVGHVWMTEDAGLNWTDVSADLPDIHHNQVLVVSDAPDVLVAATDLGIYRSDDAGQSWRVYGDELPNVAVDWVQGFTTRGTASTTPQLNLGAEWDLCRYFMPRAGVCLGGASGRGLAGGLGLGAGPWRMDLAAMTRGGLTGGGTKGVGFAAGTSLKF